MIRLILLVLLFLAALLAVFKAPFFQAWFAAILVGEFPWIMITAEMFLIIWGFKVARFQIVGNVIAVTSLLLFISPIIWAYVVASGLRKDLQNSFQAKAGKASKEVEQMPFPFAITKMVTGIGATKIPFTSQTYSRPDDAQPLTLDFYAAQSSGPRPCIIVIHGGSWESGDSQQLPELNSVLSLHGYHVATVNYRLAPEHISPAPVEDIAQALHYLKENSKSLQIDTSNFILLGRSAGAQIALAAAYTLHDGGIKGVVDFYGPADMIWGYSQPSNPLIMDSRKVMNNYLGGTYAQVPENFRVSSPIEFVDANTVPTLLIHGQNDVLVFYEHSIRLSKKLKANKIQHYLLTLPWATHGCDFTLNGPSGQLSTYSILYFLRCVLNT